MADRRVALVCGGSRGIGLAVAEALAASRVDVTLLSRTAESLETAADQVEEITGSRPDTIVGDVAETDTPERAVEQVVERHGRLDILVNNAGGPPPGPFRDVPDEVWEDAFQQNLLSVIRFTREAVPHMLKGRWGRVVSITTALAFEPDPNMVVSATLRAGVAAFTKATARELAATGVTVNNVCPSAVRTERAVELARSSAAEQGRMVDEVLSEAASALPIGRLASPPECAAAVAFLASDAASYVTGVSLLIDGAWTRGIH